MSSVKGYPTKKKITSQITGYTPAQTETEFDHVTVTPSNSDKVLLDTFSHGSFRTTALAKTANANSTTRVLLSTAHGALKGDMVRFEGTAANPYVIATVLSVPDADTIILGTDLQNSIATSDEFFVLKAVTSRFDETGAVSTSSGPVQFVRNAANQNVIEDTVTAANNRPLPVKIFDDNGGPLKVANNFGPLSHAVRVAAQLGNNTGSADFDAGNTSAQTLRTRLASDDALIGTITETAPATDTASSGLNGRLQRIAQRITSLISLFPVSIGQKTSAESLAVVVASDQSAVPVSAAALPLPSGAATETTLAAMNGKIPVLGQAAMAASQPVVIASDQSAVPIVENALVIVGQAAQTAIINNILPATASASATDTANQRTASIQVVSTGTGGTFIFEQSNDNVNFAPLPVFNAALTTGVPIVAAITATASQIIYSFPVRSRFTRLRIATTITGGSIQAFSRFSSDPWAPAATLVSNPTAANLAVTANIAAAQTLATVTTVGSVTSSQSAIPGTIADVASAALTTTTTTAALTPTFGSSYQVNIPVTVVTGTLPTLDVGIEESADSGTNWYRVYDFPRITAIGSYNSPVLPLTGNRVRYVQTVGGTTPSFTRAVNRLQNSTPVPVYREITDRTINPTTTNSTSAILFAPGCAKYSLIVNQGAGGSAVVFALDGSVDGTIWANAIVSVTGVVGGTTPVVAAYNNTIFKFLRARVVAGVASTTISYVTIVATVSPGGVPEAAGNGSVTNQALTATTASTLTPPANAIGFILEAPSTNTDNIRWGIGATASTTVGLLLEPGRDTGFVPCKGNVSVCATVSGTNAADIQWIVI